MATDERPYLARLSRLFTDGIRGFLQPAGKELDLAWLSRNGVQPVVLMGRAPTSDTQAFDTIINANGRLLVQGLVESGATPVTTAWSPNNYQIGQYAVVDSGDTAGNVVANATAFASPSIAQLWALEGILVTANCDATVASRVMNLSIAGGFPQATGITVANLDFSLTGPTLTQSQEGRIFVPNSPGQIQLNDNGTITQSNTNPLPMPVMDTVTVSETLTLGEAGDVHRVVFVARRLA